MFSWEITNKVKILSFCLSATHLKGIICQHGLVESQFECLLSDFSPLYFQKLGIDIQKCFIIYTICDQTSLLKESKLDHIPQNSIKKLIKFYETSLFPINENDAFIITEFCKIKKSYFLSSHAFIKDAILSLEDNLKALQLNPDGIFSWQKALEKSVESQFSPGKNQIIFYIHENNLYVLARVNQQISLSSILKISTSHAHLTSALMSIKNQNMSDDCEVFYIGDNTSLETLIKSEFPNIAAPLLQSRPAHLFQYGSALLANKNKHNLIYKLPIKKQWPKFQIGKKIRTINYISSLLILTISGMIMGLKLYREHQYSLSPVSGKRVSLHRSLRDMETLNVFRQIALEAPTPLEIMAYFSSHPILNKTDKGSSLSTSFSYLKYQLLSLQKAKVTICFNFPSEAIRQEFEKHLKIHKISFTHTSTTHATIYDMEFSKHLICKE